MTVQPADLIKRWTTVAQRDNTPAGGYGVKVHPSGRFSIDGTRCTEEAALAHIQSKLEAPMTEATAKQTKEPKRTGFSFDALNQATKDLFFRLCEEIQTATRDHGMTAAARLGTDVKVPLTDAPRLTNLKKAGLLETVEGEKKSHKMLRLTDEGRAIWAAHTGADLG
ncbi:hypothetical protein S2L_14 [Cyanophage S-2L]|nr:hypothetical protein S2L_14 [Cyanophage S-2L]